MPELPDVEVLKRYLDSTALHQEITAVTLKTDEILAGTSREHLKQALNGHSLTGTCRHGKYLFAHLEGGSWLTLHFGMTGDLKYYKKESSAPDYAKLWLDFANDYRLAFVNPRKFGEVGLVTAVDDFIAEKELGPDVLSDGFDFAAFREALNGRRAMIKSALMNQNIMAGVGNVYADEILFQARVHPRTKVSALDNETLRRIYDILCSVLTTAIECDAEPSQFPDDYIIPRRSPGADCPRCDGTVRRIKVSGRSTYFCPDCVEVGP